MEMVVNVINWLTLDYLRKLTIFKIQCFQQNVELNNINHLSLKLKRENTLQKLKFGHWALCYLKLS